MGTWPAVAELGAEFLSLLLERRPELQELIAGKDEPSAPGSAAGRGGAPAPARKGGPRVDDGPLPKAVAAPRSVKARIEGSAWTRPEPCPPLAVRVAVIREDDDEGADEERAAADSDEADASDADGGSGGVAEAADGNPGAAASNAAAREAGSGYHSTNDGLAMGDGEPQSPEPDCGSPTLAARAKGGQLRSLVLTFNGACITGKGLTPDAANALMAAGSGPGGPFIIPVPGGTPVLCAGPPSPPSPSQAAAGVGPGPLAALPDGAFRSRPSSLCGLPTVPQPPPSLQSPTGSSAAARTEFTVALASSWPASGTQTPRLAPIQVPVTDMVMVPPDPTLPPGQPVLPGFQPVLGPRASLLLQRQRLQAALKQQLVLGGRLREHASSPDPGLHPSCEATPRPGASPCPDGPLRPLHHSLSLSNLSRATGMAGGLGGGGVVGGPAADRTLLRQGSDPMFASESAYDEAAVPGPEYAGDDGQSSPAATAAAAAAAATAAAVAAGAASPAHAVCQQLMQLQLPQKGRGPAALGPQGSPLRRGARAAGAVSIPLAAFHRHNGLLHTGSSHTGNHLKPLHRRSDASTARGLHVVVGPQAAQPPASTVSGDGAEAGDGAGGEATAPLGAAGDAADQPGAAALGSPAAVCRRVSDSSALAVGVPAPVPRAATDGGMTAHMGGGGTLAMASGAAVAFGRAAPAAVQLIASVGSAGGGAPLPSPPAYGPTRHGPNAAGSAWIEPLAVAGNGNGIGRQLAVGPPARRSPKMGIGSPKASTLRPAGGGANSSAALPGPVPPASPFIQQMAARRASGPTPSSSVHGGSERAEEPGRPHSAGGGTGGAKDMGAGGSAAGMPRSQSFLPLLAAAPSPPLHPPEKPASPRTAAAAVSAA